MKPILKSTKLINGARIAGGVAVLGLTLLPGLAGLNDAHAKKDPGWVDPQKNGMVFRRNGTGAVNVQTKWSKQNQQTAAERQRLQNLQNQKQSAAERQRLQNLNPTATAWERQRLQNLQKQNQQTAWERQRLQNLQKQQAKKTWQNSKQNSKRYQGNTSDSWYLASTRDYSTAASANRAADILRRQGRNVDFRWNPTRKVYEVREFRRR